LKQVTVEDETTTSKVHAISPRHHQRFRRQTHEQANKRSALSRKAPLASGA